MAILQTVNKIGLREILSVIVAVVAARLVYYAFFHPLSIYPGPQLAAQTYLWRFFHYFRGNLYLVDYELHRKYGPVVRDGPNSLLVSDLEAYKSVYGSKVFEKGDFYRAIPLTSEPIAFATQTYEQHRKARKHLAAGFTPKAVAGYEQIIAKNVELWINKIASEYRKSDEPVNLAPLIRLLQFDSVVELIYGRSIGLLSAGEDVDEAIGSKEMALRMGFGVGLVPWMSRTFGTELVSAQIRKPQYTADGRLIGIRAIEQKVREPMRLAREGKLNAVAPPIFQHLVDDEPDGSNAAQQDLTAREALNVVFAGTGSTAAGLNAVLYELGTHHTWQNRVFEELRSLTPSSSQSPWNLPYSDLSKLPNLRAVIKESLRLSPPFPSSFQREVSMNGGSVTIPGLPEALPPGTKIGTNHYVICRSRAVFGDDADEFCPERWLDLPENEQSKRMEDAWSVFGRGPRMCVGKDLAMMMLYKAIAAFLLRWEIKGSAEGLKRNSFFEFQVQELTVYLAYR